MDLADQIDDYICSFEGIGDLAMDSLAMFIFIWAVVALFLIWLCKFLYNKYVKKDDTTQLTSSISKTNSSVSNSLNGANKLLDGDKLRRSEPRDILASKDVKELSAKPKLGSGSGRGRTGGGGYVAPTPPTRKRIVRQSPGPEMRKKRSVAPPSNVVGPETTSVTWTSQVFRWLYSDLVIVNELLNTWVQALNESLKSSNETNGVGVEIVRVLPDSPPPSLANLFCQAEESHPSDMVITCDCDSQPVLQVKAYRQKNGKLDTSHYKVTISRLRARLQAAMSYNTLKGYMKIEGYPDIRITMNSVGAIKAIDQDEQQLQDVISEILTNAIKDTIYPVDFSIYSTCPRAEIEETDIPVNLPIHYDSMAFNMENLNTSNRLSGNFSSVARGKRLLVKIVKGEGLASGDGCYVVIEMDEPPQKNQTGGRQGTNPYWDEHFLFDLSQQSAEILFEVYDSPVKPNDPPKFLGLGLVGIDELAVGPASSQILALQPRPYETTNVQGAIMVEFVFIEGAEIPIGPRPYKLKEALRISTPIINEHLRNGADLADAAVKALQDGSLTTNGNPSKSTLIIHSVQRSRSPFKVELNKDGVIVMSENGNCENKLEEENCIRQEIVDITTPNNLIDNNNSAPDIIENYDKPIDIENDSGNNGFNETIDVEFGRPAAQSSPHTNGNGGLTINNHSNTNSLGRDQQLIEDQERGRSRKKRDFFGTLKRRLGKSKTRTRSADREMIPIDANNPLGASRSLSMDRGANSTSNSFGQKIVVPTLDHSRRSSISESSGISGFSSASTKTYLHEASALVLETVENGIKRHFLVPLAIAQRPRWRRKGTKLHIYNDHTFVAKHLSGSGLNCSICTKSIPRRPGKQGYECRDCQLICHKQCHIRAPQSCPNPTVLSMELSKLNSAAADRSIRKL